MSEIKLTEKKLRSLVHSILGSTGTFVLTNIALKAKFGSEGAEILGFIANKDRSFKQSDNKEHFIKQLTPNAQDAIRRGFIYTTQYQIEDSLEISIRTQTRLFKILQDDGVLSIEQHDIPKKNFFKINHERLIDIIEQYDDEREERLKQRKLKRREDLEKKKKKQLAKMAGLLKPVGPEYKDTNNNARKINNSFSKEKENASAESNDGSCEPVEQHVESTEQNNNSPDSENEILLESYDDEEEPEFKKFSREILIETSEQEIFDQFIELGLLSTRNRISDIYQFIESKSNSPAKTHVEVAEQKNNSPAKTESEVTVESKPHIARRGIPRLADDLNNYWSKCGFVLSNDKYKNKIKNILTLLTNGNFYSETGLGEENRKYTREDLFLAVDNRKRYYDSAVGKAKLEIKKMPMWMWLYSEKSKKSFFLLDLTGATKSLKDDYPDLTEAIKKEYNKRVCGGSSGDKWTFIQNQNFISASNKLVKFVNENKKRMNPMVFRMKEENLAGYLVRAVISSKNSVLEGIKTSFLCSKITFNESLPSYLVNQNVMKEMK